MAGPNVIKIGSGPNYAPDKPNTTAIQSTGVQFVPPAEGCTLCITQGKIDGKTTINLTSTTTYHGHQLDVGLIKYNTYKLNTNCSNPPKRPIETVGNSIDVGSGVPK